MTFLLNSLNIDEIRVIDYKKDVKYSTKIDDCVAQEKLCRITIVNRIGNIHILNDLGISEVEFIVIKKGQRLFLPID